MAKVVITDNLEALARHAARQWVEIAQAAIAARGEFLAVLAGGNTPRRLYELLATPEFSDHIAWPQVHLFWGDERNVLPNCAESNYYLAYEALISKVAIPPAQLHRLRGEIHPQQAADDYERELRAFFASRTDNLTSRFDLVLLGLGDDGHTASLFPHTTGLQEKQRWVVAQYVPTLAAWRLTLTPAALNAAAHIIFLVTGAGKAEIFRQIQHGPQDPDRLPAQLIIPINGRLEWLVTREVVT